MVTSPETFPFIVVGNKTDLEDARAISKESADQIVKDLGDGVIHIETSAKDNNNIKEALFRNILNKN